MQKVLSKNLSFIILHCVLLVVSVSCNSPQKSKQKVVEKPLNISVFLDLSDRLTRKIEPSHMSRDTAIIGYIVDYFKAHTLGPQILQSKNSIKIFFYPAPHSSDIATLANELSVNMEQYNGKDKRITLENMKAKFQGNLTQIYNKTISEENWIGCDIWDFFNSRKVDSQCIKKDARNILIILTDGYLFDQNNKIKEGNSYSYILPQTLEQKDASLIVRRKGLNDLEVRILEVNPYTKEQGYKMIPILEKWLKEMGISEGNLTVAETDLPTNTYTVIKSFLE